ncbi:MAG TPA: shikimate kinase, partial [Oceanipulchritudo sp.]|nr:shikimate kinase [Oceanipulchritudo sp.]
MKQKLQRSRPNIYLIGFMGVGKSAVGRALARALRMRFIDSDHAIEERVGQTIANIFKEQGEAAFRQMEREFIESGHPEEGTVVSCGGGLPIQPGMSELLKSKGVVICLFANAETIVRRTIGNPKRPLLNVENPEERVRELMEQREPIYMAAGIGLSTEGRGIQEVVKNIARIYRREISQRAH